MVYPIEKMTIFPIARLWIKKINGLENVPKNKSFIIAANHSSYMDHFVLGYIVIPHLDKKLHFLAKKEHFDSIFQRMWHNYAGAIPIDRQSGGKRALNSAVRALKEGKIIGIYPEGTRTLTGKLQRAKTGIARIALLSKTPVLPIGLTGTFEILPKGKYIPRMKRVVMGIGKPVHFDKYYGKPMTKMLLREITTKIMKEIAKLSNQKYDFD